MSVQDLIPGIKADEYDTIFASSEITKSVSVAKYTFNDSVFLHTALKSQVYFMETLSFSLSINEPDFLTGKESPFKIAVIDSARNQVLSLYPINFSTYKRDMKINLTYSLNLNTGNFTGENQTQGSPVDIRIIGVQNQTSNLVAVPQVKAFFDSVIYKVSTSTLEKYGVSYHG